MMNKDKNNDKIRKIVKKGLTLSLCAVLAGGVAAGSFEGFSALTGETTVQAADKNDAKLTYAKSEKKADKDDAKEDDSKSDSKKSDTAKGSLDVSDIAAEGGKILFVGTKKQAQDAIKVEAERCGMYYVNERWLGGMLTNFKTIKSRIARLKEIERMSEDGTFDVLPKKEVIQIKKEWEKLEKNLGGIKEMKKIPDAIFVVDPKKERICVQEAHTLGIPLIGIADTNCDPEELDYVIPGNDDAIRAVKLIVSKMADAVIEANQGEAGADVYEEAEAAEEVAEATEE